MISLSPTVATVNTNIDFVVAIPEPTVSELVSPYMLGALDAEQGELCVPEMYFTQLGQQREYAEGHESVAGETLLSRQILGKDDPSAVAYAQGKADYASGYYWPGSIEAPVLDAYVRGWNDTYAAANNINLSR